MDIGKDKKIEKLSNISTPTFGQKKDYIPVLHSDDKDTVELEQTNIRQPKKTIGSVLGKLKNLIGIESKSGNGIPADKMNSLTEEVCEPTKESILARLEKIDLPETLKNKLINYLETQEQIDIVHKFLTDSKLYENESLQENIDRILDNTDTPEKAKAKINLLDGYLSDPKLHENEWLQRNIERIVYSVHTSEEAEVKINLLQKYFSDPRLYKNVGLKENIERTFDYTYPPEQGQSTIQLLEKYLSDSNLYKNEWVHRHIGELSFHAYTPEKVSVANRILSSPELYENDGVQENFMEILDFINTPEDAKAKISLMDKYLSDSKLYENEDLRNNIGGLISHSNTPEEAELKISLLDKYLSDSKLYGNKRLGDSISTILATIDTQEKMQIKMNFLDKYLSEPNFYENEWIQRNVVSILYRINTPKQERVISKLLSDLVIGETTPECVVSTVENSTKLSYRQVQKLQKTVGSEFFNKIYRNSTDVVAAANLIGLYGKNNINEIPIAEKRNVLRSIVKINTDLFSISDYLKQTFPLIPTDKKEYCTLLPALVKSLGIEVKTLAPEQVAKFDESLEGLSLSLSNLSDKEFDNLSIAQTYSKDEFIKDTLSIVKGLSKTEKQKVYDYFGFELHHNRKAPTGFSITGYPVNINNGKKLAQITDENTKQVVETLREKVIAFSENNPIQSNNPVISQQLADILEFLPELRSSIGRMQYGAHEFDVIKHSLKVMQKIAQNPSFEKLNSSDKKIMMLSALLHDISKAEVVSDPLHNFESSFDAYYIAKKFNLTQDEQIKMYTLINHHEWLKYVNKQGLSEEELTKRLQSVAFDFQNDNLFEMAKIFTEADIKSITKGDGLYDKFGTALDVHSVKIEEYIAELQKTKPILPTTKLPKASEIASKITNVNADYSTDIKGVYVKDGLVVVRYNEVEDWEKLGFPQGSISRGIETINPVGNTQINTGNIKFIAHGLEYENQLSNFDAFALPDSDALLSVSYMERPESKYRLFRPQGVLLDVDSKYIHGGGETDSGSGYGKNIDEFKSNYIFGGVRQCDRDYISDLIKETLGFNDEEYVNFIQKNQNKSMLEIEPVEARETLIKKFALINSNTRRGNREYNEMYVSNPKVQGCFAYSTKDYIGDTIQFIDAQQEFLKDYAKENDLPFFVFAD